MGTKKPLVRLKCTVCGQINYTVYKAKKKGAQAPKLKLRKHCQKCKKHTEHVEVKIS